MKKSERNVLLVICVITFCLLGFFWWLGKQVTEKEIYEVDAGDGEELLETGWELLGTALDAETGAPIAGLEIRVWNRDKARPEEGSKALLTATTNRDGRFRFRNLDIDKLALDTDNVFYFVQSTADLFVQLEKPPEPAPEPPGTEAAAGAEETRSPDTPDTTAQAAAAAPPANRQEVTLQVQKGGAVRGTVARAKGSPCAGAFVLLAEAGPTGPKRTWKADADETGAFLFEQLPPGLNAELTAYHRTEAPASAQKVRISSGEEISVALTLQPQATMTGKVLDPAGQPVPGALIFPCRSDAEREPLWKGLRLSERDKLKAGLATRTGLDGSYWLAVDAAGPLAGDGRQQSFVLAARAEGFLASRSREIAITDSGPAPLANDIQLPHPAAIRGTVQNGAHKPMANVRVSAVTVAGKEMYRSGCKTEANGKFSLSPLLRNSTSTLTFSAPGFPEKIVDSVKSGGEALMVILDAGGSLKGAVKAASDGKPVRNFRVLLKPIGSDSRRIVARPGADGAFAIDTLAAGAWDLAITADGFRSASIRGITIQAGQEAPPLSVALEKSTLISGTVLADAKGKPAAGVRVTPALRRSEGFVDHKTGETVVTDAKGGFSFIDLDPGTWLLDLSRNDPPLVWRHGPINLPVGGVIKDQKVVIGPGSGRLDVTVLGPDGKPKEGALVEVAIAGELKLPSGGGIDSFRTGKDGKLDIGAYSPGRKTLRVSLDKDLDRAGSLVHCETRTLTIKKGETTAVTVSFAATPACRVFGTITRGGGQVGEGVVLAVPIVGSMPDMKIARKTAIDSTGNYAFAALPAGRYLFYIDGPTLEPLSRKPVVVDQKACAPASADAATGSLQRDFDMAAGLIAGIVVDRATGKPLARASVYVYYLARDKSGVTGAQVGSFFTGDDGAFSFPGLKNGEYNLAAHSMAGVGHLEKLILKPGGALKNLKIQLVPGGTLSVSIKDEAGKPLPGVMVRAEKSGVPVVTTTRQGLCLTDSAGRAVIAPLEPGDYRVVIGAPGRVSNIEPAVKVEAGKTAAVESPLKKGPQIVLTVQTADGKPVKRCRLAVLGPGNQWVGPPVSGTLIARGVLSSNTGKYTLGGYAPGSFQVHILAEGFRAKTAPVKIPAEGAIPPLVVKLDRVK